MQNKVIPAKQLQDYEKAADDMSAALKDLEKVCESYGEPSYFTTCMVRNPADDEVYPELAVHVEEGNSLDLVSGMAFSFATVINNLKLDLNSTKDMNVISGLAFAFVDVLYQYDTTGVVLDALRVILDRWNEVTAYDRSKSGQDGEFSNLLS